MELCTTLQSRVLELEKTKTNKSLEIDSLKRRVKKLKKKQKSRNHKLKRLYKVRLFSKVESSDDNEDLGEDASKQERKINDIDANEDITLVIKEQEQVVEEASEDINTAELIVDAAQVNAAGEITAASIATTDSAATTMTVEEVTLAQALMEIKSTKLKAKGLQAKEQQELTDKEKATLFMKLLEKRRKFFAAKRAEEKKNKPPTHAQQRKIMCTYLKNMEGKKLKDLKNKSFDSIRKMFDRDFKRKIGIKKIGKDDRGGGVVLRSIMYLSGRGGLVVLYMVFIRIQNGLYETRSTYSSKEIQKEQRERRMKNLLAFDI
nr:hypothetical protein [Tanacetum cinerariifolium]